MAIRVDDRYKALSLLIFRGIDVPQEFLEGKGLRPDDGGLVAGVSKLLQFITHAEGNFQGQFSAIALGSLTANGNKTDPGWADPSLRCK